MLNEKKYYLIIIFFSYLLSYEVGDVLATSTQNTEYSICYGAQLDPDNDGIFKFSEYNGDLNGGDYYVIFLEMGTSW